MLSTLRLPEDALENHEAGFSAGSLDASLRWGLSPSVRTQNRRDASAESWEAACPAGGGRWGRAGTAGLAEPRSLPRVGGARGSRTPTQQGTVRIQGRR